jgi:hypothetical protein
MTWMLCLVIFFSDGTQQRFCELVPSEEVCDARGYLMAEALLGFDDVPEISWQCAQEASEGGRRFAVQNGTREGASVFVAGV